METARTYPVITCSRCKRQSTVEAAFTKEKHFFGLITRWYCPDCQLRRWVVEAVFGFLLMPLIGLAAYLLFPGFWVGELVLFCSVYIIVSIPITIVHELAHATAARLLGFRAFGIRVGVGKLLYTTRLLGMRWEFHFVPLAGATSVGGPPGPNYRLRSFIIYAAGPLTHAAIAFFCGLALPILSLMETNILVYSFVMLIFFGSLLSLAVNLWPRRTPSLNGVAGTDGWQMFHLLTEKPAELTRRYAAYYAMESLEAYKDNDVRAAKAWVDRGLALSPKDVNLLNVLGFVYIRTTDFAAARQAFIQALEAEADLPPGVKYLLLNNIAFADLMLADPALIPQADEYSAQAYQQVPWEPAVSGTRGAALVTLGRPDEGLPLLKFALDKNPDKMGKATEACWIARGELRRGRRLEAVRYLEAARSLDPACALLAPVGRELEESPSA